MSNASTLGDVSPELLKVVERAQREPEGRFHSLAHLIDVSALERAYHRMRKDAAVGVDGITKEQYGQALEANLQDLHARLRAKRYRHQPIRRVYIPKEQGKTRPIGISAFEDKLVQDAVREVLEAIYEQDFLDCSYGFRPGRSAHDAIRTLDQIVHRGEVSWILEADVVSFFDSLDRTKLKEMLEIRVADGSLLRLIGKCLHVGVLDRRGTLHAGDRHRPGVGALAATRQRHAALRAGPLVRDGGEAAAAGQGNPDPLRRRLRHWFRARGGCAACPGGAGQAACALRTDPASGQDPATALPASAGGAEERERFGLLRLPRVHALLGALSARSMGDGVQDSAGEPTTGDPVRHRLVPSPSAPSGKGSARSAHETIARPLQLLRRERKLS